MINPTGKKLEKLLFGIFDEAIQGVDTYKHNGSMWLIFTDDKKWVVEYTKEQTLRYNYYFFKQEMDMVGLDCVENKDLIQEWFEYRFLNKKRVKDTKQLPPTLTWEVEDTIQNGVKHTQHKILLWGILVEDTIQNGVKHTSALGKRELCLVEDTIQNGVKHTRGWKNWPLWTVEDTIQNGVKHTRIVRRMFESLVEDTIQNGVKHTIPQPYVFALHVEDTIQNGVKYCEDGDWLDGDERFEDIIQNGMKEK